MAHSGVFRTMFTDPISIAILADDDNKLLLTQTTPTAVTQMLTYMYSGSLPENFLNEHASDLLQIAEKYALEPLKMLIDEQ